MITNLPRTVFAGQRHQSVCIETRAPANNSMNFVTAVEEKLGEVRSILACNSGDDGLFDLRGHLSIITVTRRSAFLRILLTGSSGHLGSHLLSALTAVGNNSSFELISKTSRELDLTNQRASESVASMRPDLIIHAAADLAGSHSPDTSGPFPNRSMTQNLLRAMHPGATLILFGTTSAFASEASWDLSEEAFFDNEAMPMTAYGIDKRTTILEALQEAKVRGVRVAVLNLPNLFSLQSLKAKARHLSLPVSAIARTLAASRRQARELVVPSAPDVARQILHTPDLASWLASRVCRVQELPEVLNLATLDHVTVSQVYSEAVWCLEARLDLVFDSSKTSGPKVCFLNDSLARERHDWNPRQSFLGIYRKALDQVRMGEVEAPWNP